MQRFINIFQINHGGFFRTGKKGVVKSCDVRVYNSQLIVMVKSKKKKINYVLPSFTETKKLNLKLKNVAKHFGTHSVSHESEMDPILNGMHTNTIFFSTL